MIGASPDSPGLFWRAEGSEDGRKRVLVIDLKPKKACQNVLMSRETSGIANDAIPVPASDIIDQYGRRSLPVPLVPPPSHDGGLFAQFTSNPFFTGVSHTKQIKRSND